MKHKFPFCCFQFVNESEKDAVVSVNIGESADHLTSYRLTIVRNAFELHCIQENLVCQFTKTCKMPSPYVVSRINSVINEISSSSHIRTTCWSMCMCTITLLSLLGLFSVLNGSILCTSLQNSVTDVLLLSIHVKLRTAYLSFKYSSSNPSRHFSRTNDDQEKYVLE